MLSTTSLPSRLLARIGALIAAMTVGAACQSPAPTGASASTAPKTIVAAGYSVPYVDEGRGEPIVFVHGALGDYRTWDPQRAALAGRYRTIAYTQRYFDAQPAARRAVQLDSARSMQVLVGHELKPDISCEQLGRIRAPVAIVRGGDSRPFFRHIADAAMRCLPGRGQLVIPNASHVWPAEQPAAFSEAVAGFIASQKR